MGKAEVAVVVGTQKGVFVLRSSDDRKTFVQHGPQLPGDVVYSVAVDNRGDGTRLLAGATSEHWGSVVRASADLGEQWTDPEVGNIKFPEDTGAAVRHIWQLHPVADQPGVVYAGVEPASLFRSEDGGETFTFVRGLWDHPHRPQWEPGGGGLCLHTIVPNRGDSQRMVIAISAAGAYRTEDGGQTWEAANAGIHAVAQPDVFPEFGQCVHRVAADPEVPDRLFLQHHGGVFRSDDFGRKWTEISEGLPSDFGFPVVAHPRRGDTAYVIPLDSDERRWVVDGRARVFRTSDGGASWTGLGNGLPQEAAYLAVLRDAFCTDGCDPAGLYFGTRSGEVYGSADEGETWQQLANHLPPVLSVRAAPVRSSTP